MTDEDRDRLEEIVDLIDLIDAHLEGVAEAAFSGDRHLIDATAYRLLHIGENAMRLSPVLRARYPHIPWRSMGDMRNYLAHDYGGSNLAMVWATATNDLEPLRAMCNAELGIDRTRLGE